MPPTPTANSCCRWWKKSREPAVPPATIPLPDVADLPGRRSRFPEPAVCRADSRGHTLHSAVGQCVADLGQPPGPGHVVDVQAFGLRPPCPGLGVVAVLAGQM